MARAKTQLLICREDVAGGDGDNDATVALVPVEQCDTVAAAEKWIRQIGEVDLQYHLVRVVKIVTKRLLSKVVLE